MVQTVTGKQDPSKLGVVLTHEHFALDFNVFYVEPPKNVKRFLEGNIDLKNIGFVRQYPYGNRYNVNFNDSATAEAVTKDAEFFHESGGGTIVENSSIGLKRNIPLMVKISEKTGLNVIAGTGYYVAATQEQGTLDVSKEKMYDVMVKELTEGCLEYPSVKAGFIGEVGSAWPIEEFEKRAIIATGEVQEQLKCSVSFHPGRDKQAPFEIMRIYQEAGGDARKAIMSHLDRTLLEESDLMAFADETNCYCQFDLFGTECLIYQLNPRIDMPSDTQRIERVKLLRDDEKLHRVLLSHDIHTKHRLIDFGGHGYSHIINNILPKMKLKGFTEEEINLLTIENPKTWLSA